MTERDKNQLVKMLLDKNTKPNLSKCQLSQLLLMYVDFIDNNYNWTETEILKMYSAKTFDIINSICNDVKTYYSKNNEFMDQIYNVDEETEKKKIIINFIMDLWKKLPLIDESGDVIECGICLNYITNIDNMTLKCGHKIHSSCFINYLFTNLKNTYNSNYDLTKLLKCPNCRIYLTNTIDNYTNQITNNTNDEENEIINNINVNYNQEYRNINHIDFFTNNYNLITNSITNRMVNNLFMSFNPINDSNVFVDYNNDNIFNYDDTNSDNSFSINSDSDSDSDSNSE